MEEIFLLLQYFFFIDIISIPMDWVVSSVPRLGLGNPKYYRVGNIKINHY